MSNAPAAPLYTQHHKNLRHLYWDVFWWGILAGSTLAFLNVYAARLGASSFQIGLLTAGPAVINLFFSLPVGRWLENRPIIRTTVLSSIFFRLGYLILIPLPLLADIPWQLKLIIISTLLASIPGTVLAIGFNAMFAEVVPTDLRATAVGRRNALVALSLVAASLACGQILERVIFPLNYQIVFTIGFIGSALSSYHLAQLRSVSEGQPIRLWKPLLDFARPGLYRFGDALRNPTGLRFLTRAGEKPLLNLALLRSPYGVFVGALLIFYTCQYLAIPLFPLMLVNELELSDEIISLGSAIFYLAMLASSLRLKSVVDRFGNRRVMLAGTFLYGSYPLLLALAADQNLYLAASVSGGIIWGLTSGSMVNRLMERVGTQDIPAGMAIHNLALNLGILAGSVIGPLIGDNLGLRTALFASAGLRVLASLLLARWG